MFNVFKNIFSLFVLLGFLPALVFAQFNFGITNLNNELSIEISPEYPRPNERVSLYLTMYTADLNSAEIFWYKNDKLELSGTGKTNFTFETGNIGENTKIDIVIKLLNGQSFSRVINLSPAGVDIVWESGSYVYPFYKGKALHSKQGLLKIVAMPEFIKNGTRISPENLIYEWSNDTDAYFEQSGFGKRVLYINGSTLGKSEIINLLVKNNDGTLVASNSISIEPNSPEIVFYENNPYYGNIFDIAIKDNTEMKTNEFQILAVPYNLSRENNLNLKYEWRLNGNLITELEQSRTAIFRKPENESGVSKISLRIENINRFLQYAEKDLLIKFSK